ncbi:MAG: hypoxanthine phosphoribosyltransferase [Firmicutes bacterium]|jgi:hypoxanthine phosphoribosyltransferase|nr:hypoxanthine phosphoribosyltransferase [Bacillota bacterium]HQD39063.1 hypoxanthine phosphoribosyltransferase [Bacillota bacterium]
MHLDVESILITTEQLQEKVKELGAQITKDYKGKDLLAVCILKGSVIFFADLLRAIDLPLETDFVAISSYGHSTSSSGVVRLLKDLDQNIQGRNVLVVEDIIDSGLTLKYLLDNLSSRKPASLAVCTLLDKPERRMVDIDLAYNGFSIPDKFVVGYGLDYAEKYRNLPYIGVLKPEIYKD